MRAGSAAMRKPMPRSAVAVFVFLAVCAGVRPVFAQTESEVRAADADQDGRFDHAELLALFLGADAEIKAMRAAGAPSADINALAEDRAEDVLTYRCGDCATVSFSLVLAFIQERTWARGVTRERIGWRTLAIRRFATDGADPRQVLPDKRPFIFSYKRDNEAADKDQVNLLGGIQFYKAVWALDPATEHFVTATPALEMEIDGGKKSHESSIEIALPLSYEYSRAGRARFAGFTTAVTPKFLTDRAFERRGWEVVVEGHIASTLLGNMGYTSWLGREPDTLSSSILSLYWRPSLRVETGRITNAAGNARLEALAEEGHYTRLVPRIVVVARPERWLPALSITADYFHRFDGPEGKSAGYGETRITYDLTAQRAFSIGLVITRGRRPPDFAPVDRILIGVGVLQ